jgi:hypothetical protein
LRIDENVRNRIGWPTLPLYRGLMRFSCGDAYTFAEEGTYIKGILILTYTLFPPPHIFTCTNADYIWFQFCLLYSQSP